jgi:hypothetical protein
MPLPKTVDLRGEGEEIGRAYEQEEAGDERIEDEGSTRKKVTPGCLEATL